MMSGGCSSWGGMMKCENKSQCCIRRSRGQERYLRVMERVSGCLLLGHGRSTFPRATPPRACPPHHIRCATPETGSRIGGSNDRTGPPIALAVLCTIPLPYTQFPFRTERAGRRDILAPKIITICLPLDSRNKGKPRGRAYQTPSLVPSSTRSLRRKAKQTLFNVATATSRSNR